MGGGSLERHQAERVFCWGFGNLFMRPEAWVEGRLLFILGRACARSFGSWIPWRSVIET